MSERKAQRLSAEIVQEATTWFVEFNDGEVDQPDREAFVSWLRRSPEHIRAYLQVTAHWEDAGARTTASVPSIDELVEIARESTHENVIPIKGVRRDDEAKRVASANESPISASPTHRPRRYSLAASLAIAMIGVSGLLWLAHERGIYSTDIGEQRSIKLGDNSTVELNAHSKMRVTLREHERDVDLIEGQALFRVAKDQARPFIVHSGDTNVLAVGTEFDVNKHLSGTTVTVVEGRVAVFSSLQSSGSGPLLPGQSPGDKPSTKAPGSPRPATTARSDTPQKNDESTARGEVFLAAGDQLTMSGMSITTASNADVGAATAWTQKQIVFNSTPLSDVVDEFNRYNRRQLLITDPKIANTKISGQFSSSNPDSLLKGLDALNTFHIRETPSRIEISAK